MISKNLIFDILPSKERNKVMSKIPDFGLMLFDFVDVYFNNTDYEDENKD
jgi:hypothetical protein